jgi:hypothetical protein
MKEENFKCDQCGFSVSKRMRYPGWIYFDIKNAVVAIKNEQMDNGEAMRFPEIGKKDFCSLSCLLKWFAVRFHTS